MTEKKKLFHELEAKPKSELEKALGEARDKLWSLKSDLAAGKVKNVGEIKAVKRTIARILTVFHGKKANV